MSMQQVIDSITFISQNHGKDRLRYPFPKPSLLMASHAGGEPIVSG